MSNDILLSQADKDLYSMSIKIDVVHILTKLPNKGVLLAIRTKRTALLFPGLD